MREKLGILFPLQVTDGWGVERIRLVTDMDNLAEALEVEWTDRGFDFVRMDLSTPQVIGDEMTVVVCALKNANPQFVASLYQSSGIPGAKNRIFLTSFAFDTRFHFDPIYIPWLGMPCHLCRWGWLESQWMARLGTGAYSFYQFYQHMLRDDIAFSHAVAISKLTEVRIAFEISQQLEVVVGARKALNDNLNFASSLRLETGMVDTDLALHWHACPCLQENTVKYFTQKGALTG